MRPFQIRPGSLRPSAAIVFAETILWWCCVQFVDSASCIDGSVYMAQSGIPGAGWGVFAGRTYHIGDVIGPSSVAIPVIDLPNNEELYNQTSNVFGMLPEYLWEPANIGGFGEADSVRLFLPGIISLVNHHPTLDNVIPSGLQHRQAQEATDTSSPYYGFHLVAARTIQQDEELFIDYNGALQMSRLPYLPSSVLFPHLYNNGIDPMLPKQQNATNTTTSQTKPTTTAGQLPLAEHYEEADKIVQATWDLHETLLSEHSANGQSSLTAAQWIDLLYRIRTNELLIHPQARAITKLLPRTFPELQRAHEVGVARFLLTSQMSQQYCLDGIRESSSVGQTITAAANKSFQSGEIIAVSPLLLIPNGEKAMAINTTHTNATVQLLENYCFGHRYSDLRLCPITNAALIRHDRKKANVKLQWSLSSQREASSTTDILVSSLKGFVGNRARSTTLTMEYVALTDIAEGEELWIDFGSEYEVAKDSQKHESDSIVAKPPKPSSVVLSTDSNMQPYYSHECSIYPNLKIHHGAEYRSWEDFHTNRMSDPRNWPQQMAILYADNDYAPWYPCDVVDAKTAQDVYDIVVYFKGYPQHAKDSTTIIRRLKNCPKDRIRVVEAPYQSYIHDPHALRRYIPLPDSIFPFHWRTDYRTSFSWKIGMTASSISEFDYEKSLREAACGLYLAKSNIPNAGFGLYNGVDVPASNVAIGSWMPAIAVHEPQRVANWTSTWVGSEYVWNGATFSFEFDGFPDFKVLATNGLLGALGNFHTGLVNMNMGTKRNSPLLDRRKDPGAGAFTDLDDSYFQSSYPIMAGEELFISYGEHWLSGRPKFKDVPLFQNFREVDQIVGAVWSLLQLESAAIDRSDVSHILTFVQKALISSHRTKMAMLNVLDADSLDIVIERNGTAKTTVQARSQNWFEESGFCLDHIYVGNSTIPQAGKGAFSRRTLKKDTVIHTSPVIGTTRWHMAILDNYTDIATINSKQLITNYHFGHPNSTILFYPLTQMIAVNHKSSRTAGAGPNARVEFSSRDEKTKYLLQRPIEDIFDEKYSAMLLDIVATRDIAPDEEILIDYGDAWEKAWQTHVKNWKSPCTKDYDNCFESSQLIKITMNEDKHNPLYHSWSDVHLTACAYNGYHPWEDGGNVVHLSNWSKDDDGIHEHLGFTFNDEGFNYPKLPSSPIPCKVLQSHPDSDTFDVLYFFLKSQVPTNHQTEKHRQNGDFRTIVQFDGLPAQGLFFLNKPLTGDQHDPKAFRHEIHIPDSAFPPLWKDML